MSMEVDFSLYEFLNNIDKKIEVNNTNFNDISNLVVEQFNYDWEQSDHKAMESQLLREKNAIIGHYEDVKYYMDKIRNILREKNIGNVEYPSYYENIVDAIFHENWGLAGIAPWAFDATDEYKSSSSAKIIGDKIYCLINGKEVLQPQTICEKRRLQLKKALLLGKPDERMEEGFHEVYLNNGIRVTIYSGDRTKVGQDIMVFRKYVFKEMTFEKMAEKNTIPFEIIPMFKAMIKIGYNVLFSGQVRSGKTTFMICWQKYEDESLEGLAIATDPETPWHEIMPKAPIMQIIADGENLEQITKSLLRSDCDYVLLEEMRDSVAFNIGLDITSTGTQRSKGTIHTNNAIDIPYKMASKIVSKYGGDLNSCISQVFKNFNYVLEFIQLANDKSKKILKGISEFRYDEKKDVCSIHKICKYDFQRHKWTFNWDIGLDKKEIAIDNIDEFQSFNEILKDLAFKFPMDENTIIYPAYYKSRGSELNEN